jgi:Tol biopolymer transport system component
LAPVAWGRSTAPGNSRVLQGLGIPHHPFFSPNGAWIAYFDGSFAIRKVSINGGPPLTICQLASAPTGDAWGPDNSIVFVTANLSLGLLQVSANGGEPKTITVPQEDSFNGVTFLPSGKAVLYNARKSQGPLRIVAFDLTSQEHRTIVREGFDARVLGSKQIVYGVKDTIQLARFDPDTLEPAEGPIALSDSVLVTPFGGLLDFDISNNGTLVYVPASEASSDRLLVWVDRQGNEEPIAAPARAYTYPRMAPDDSRVAIDVRDGDSDIWLWDFRRLALTRFTFGPAFDQYPTWTDEGTRMVFDSSRDGVANLFQQATSGEGSPEPLARSPNPQFPHTISPDGRLLVFREETRDTGQDLFLLTLSDRQVQPLLHSPFNESNAEISPDGRWLAYESNESGDYEILVRPFPDVTAGRWQVSSGGGHKPLWARDGKELFYVSRNGALMSVKTEPGTTFTVTPPAKVIDSGRYYVGSGINGGRTYDISRDGKRFLMLKARPNVSTNITVVQNWFAELERLTPVADQ